MKFIWKQLETLCRRFHSSVAEINMYPNLLQTFANAVIENFVKTTEHR